MKYEKPISRELTNLSSATGACVSGPTVNQACNAGGSNVGPCTDGNDAGQTCNTGSTPNNPTSPCSFGNSATNCSTGSWAGIE